MDLSDRLHPLLILEWRRLLRGKDWHKPLFKFLFILGVVCLPQAVSATLFNPYFSATLFDLYNVDPHEISVGGLSLNDMSTWLAQAGVFLIWLPYRVAEKAARQRNDRINLELMNMTRLYPNGLIWGRLLLSLSDAVAWFLAFFVFLSVPGNNCFSYLWDVTGLFVLFAFSCPLIAWAARIKVKRAENPRLRLISGVGISILAIHYLYYPAMAEESPVPVIIEMLAVIPLLVLITHAFIAGRMRWA